MLYRLGHFLFGGFKTAGDTTPNPPPTSFLLLADTASFLLLSDTTSKLGRP